MVLNKYVLLLPIVIAGLSFPLTKKIHEYQIFNITNSLDTQVKAARDQKDYSRAEKLLNFLLDFQPGNKLATVELAETMDESIGDDTSLIAYYKIDKLISSQSAAAGLCDTDRALADRGDAIRRRMIFRLFQLGRYEDSMEQIAKIAGPNEDAELLKWLALNRYRLKLENRTYSYSSIVRVSIPEWLISESEKKIVDVLNHANILIPGDDLITYSLCEACLSTDESVYSSKFVGERSDVERKKLAEKLANDLLKLKPEDVGSIMVHFAIMSSVNIEAAEQDIDLALNLSPNNTTVLSQAGSHYLGRAMLLDGADSARMKILKEKSMAMYRRALDSGLTEDASVYLGIAECHLIDGENDKAMKVIEDGKRVCMPPTMPLYFRSIESLIDRREFALCKESLLEMDESLRAEIVGLPYDLQSLYTRTSRQIWAKYYIALGDYEKAAKYLLDVVASEKELSANDRANLIITLAECYMRVGQYDRAVGAYEEALILVPSNDEFRRGLAESLANSNRVSESITTLNSLQAKTGKDLIRTCELILRKQSEGVPTPSNWLMFDEQLEQARRLASTDTFLQKNPWISASVELDARILRADPGEVARMKKVVGEKLVQLTIDYDDSVTVFINSVSKLQALGLREESRALLNSQGGKFENNLDVIFLKADLLLRDGLKDQAELLLKNQLANSLEEGEAQRVKSLLRQIREKDELFVIPSSDEEGSDRLPNLIQYANRVLQRVINLPAKSTQEEVKSTVINWTNDLLEVENKLREIEGIEGTEWKYIKGRRLLALKSIGENIDIDNLFSLSSSLKRQRPRWSSTYLLSALIQLEAKNERDCIKDLVRAINFGEDGIKTYELLSELYLRDGQFSDAQALLEGLGARVSSSQRLSSVALDLAGKGGGFDMLQYAKAGTVARPNDPMAWCWLGSALELTSRDKTPEIRNNELASSEEAFSKARALCKDSSSTVMSSVFGFYVMTNQMEKLDGVLTDIRESEMPGLEKFLCLSSLEQSLGRFSDAQADLEHARELSDNPLEIDKRIASLLVKQGRNNESIESYGKLFQASPEDGDLRRGYVTLLASRGTDDDWSKIESIYKGNSSFTENVDDKRLRAELRVQRGSRGDLLIAQNLLQSVVWNSQERREEDRFRLASVYLKHAKLIEASDNNNPELTTLYASAEEQLFLLCKGSTVPVEYLYTYGDFLIDRGSVVEANEYAGKLESLYPKHFLTMNLVSRLKYLAGDISRAKGYILNWKSESLNGLNNEDAPEVRSDILLKAGEALFNIKCPREAEELLRQAFDLDDRRGLDYVRTVARSEDVFAREKAIRYLLDKMRRSNTSSLGQLLAGLLALGGVSEALEREADEVLNELGFQNQDNPSLLLSMADMWLGQRRTNKAIEAYRKIIKISPDDVVSLNNLALLLADDPSNFEEANRLIDRAIELSGRQPLLLDSKAMIYLFADRPEEAIPLLQAAVSSSSDPRLMFHLYLAFSRANRAENAASVLSKIDFNSLRKSVLTPSDRAELDKIDPQIK